MDTRRGCVCLGNVALARFVGSGSWVGELDPGMMYVTFWVGRVTVVVPVGW